MKILFQLIQNRALMTLFKALLINTSLGMALNKMSTAKSTPGGVKPQECERSLGQSKSPISYILEKDAI